MRDILMGGRDKLLYEKVFEALNGARVRYLVAGGMAVVLYGHARLTIDLDLILDLSRTNVLRFVRAMKVIGYQPRPPVRGEDFADLKIRESWRKEKHMAVFTFDNPGSSSIEVVDVFVCEPLPFRDMYRQKRVQNVRGIKVPLVSMKHLMALKKKAARDKDLLDIQELKKLEKWEAIRKKHEA